MRIRQFWKDIKSKNYEILAIIFKNLTFHLYNFSAVSIQHKKLL